MLFKNFLLLESQAYLSQKTGDLLQSFQNLQEDAEGMSKRALERALVKQVDQIRKILHGHWEDTNKEDLLVLQKIAVGIMVGLEDTDADLPGLVTSAVTEIEALTGDLEEPLNDLGPKEVDKEEEESLEYELPDEISEED